MHRYYINHSITYQKHPAFGKPLIGYCRFVEKLAGDIDNIVGIKDSSGDVGLTIEFIRLMRGMNFKVFEGKDALIYATLARRAWRCGCDLQFLAGTGFVHI